MTTRPTSNRLFPAMGASGLLLLLAGAAVAQSETPGQSRARATTQSLNAGPADSTLGARPNAQLPSRQAERTAATRTLEDLLGAVEGDTGAREARSGVTLAAGETAPAPIPVALGYYARGDKDCDQVWPGDGDLAFMTPTTFTIDFGGCAPGQFLQTGPNSWREEQMCETELGGDAGAYVVDYEMVETGVMQRTARLELDGSVEQDLWRFCELPEVPENARFRS